MILTYILYGLGVLCLWNAASYAIEREWWLLGLSIMLLGMCGAALWILKEVPI